MRGFKFVIVLPSGAEEEIPEMDVAEAQRRAQSPVYLRSLASSKRVRIEASTPIAMTLVWILSDMEKYRGKRIDAIEVTPPH